VCVCVRVRLVFEGVQFRICSAAVMRGLMEI